MNRIRTCLYLLRRELRTILSDEGTLLVLLAAPIIYATLYATAYGAEVLRNVPIGVIDESRTAASRRLVADIDAGPNCYVACMPTDMAEAERLFYERRIYGVACIPADYESALLAGRQAVVPLYLDASYFLMYRQVFQELAATLATTGAAVELQRLVAAGTQLPAAEATVQPVVYQSRTLFNPGLGYASFVLPAVLLLILQQTLLVGTGMIGGTWCERRLYRMLRPAGRRPLPLPAIVLARGSAYLLLYGLTTLYLFAVHYRLFHLPMNGRTGPVVLFLGLYLLADIAFALALSTRFRFREESILWLLWSSIPLLMLSGISFPRESMPAWLYALGQLIPSSHAITGFVRLQSMGASLGEVSSELLWLLALALLYGAAACFGLRQRIGREERETQKEPAPIPAPAPKSDDQSGESGEDPAS